MTLLGSLQGELAGVRGVMGALGPRPKGDPDAILRVAGDVSDAAGVVATLGGATAGIPSGVVFVAPASAELGNYASAAARSMNAKAQKLISLSGDLTTRARQIERAQEEYDRERRALGNAIEDLVLRIASAL